MSAAKAEVIDFSAYRRRRGKVEATPDTVPVAMAMPMAWVPTLVLVPVYFVPVH